MNGDEEALLQNLFLQYVAKLKLYKLNKGRSKVSFTQVNNITSTTKYNGTFRNKKASFI